MRTIVLNRKLHYWLSFALAIPLLVIIASGILLQLKKDWDWVQPPEKRGGCKVPAISFDQMLQALRAQPSLAVEGWQDINRIDVRPSRCMAKVRLQDDWEVQVDLETGLILQTAYRRSDWIESIHDGSFFAGDWTKLGLFLPAGIVLLFLWLSGLWMFYQPFAARRRQRRTLAAITARAEARNALPSVRGPAAD